ncbi:WD40-repeat-containing domain protein [Coniella lustricola]|uniref:WD40-repeat-containing domain protein n=1 Tax=Coniella lustricola TaxID=2025994 RepID=A0A2T3ABR6_9PEZI|nr:WD40-repeat-containing domain protein [Coniella lustricola]
MVSTPPRHLKPKRSTGQLSSASTRSRSRIRPSTARLSLQRVVGNTCALPPAFASSTNYFAYVAGAAVVVVAVSQGDQVSQRFYRARPTVTPVFSVACAPQASPSSISDAALKTSHGKRRPGKVVRDVTIAVPIPQQTLPPKTWTSRERIKAATCVSISPDQRFLAVGETGYAPRVLVFSLEDGSSDIPLVSISEHGFGVKAVAWSNDGEWLASLGTVSDGFLYIWKIDFRTGSAILFQQNRCTANVTGMIWLRNYLITFGLRHVKAWKIADELHQPGSPSRAPQNPESPPQSLPRTLLGRNVVLGLSLETCFTCASAVDETRALLCSDSGYVCLLDGAGGHQMKLTQLTDLGFPLSCCVVEPAADQPVLWVGSRDGQFVSIGVDSMVHGSEAAVRSSLDNASVLAMGFTNGRLVTVDANRNIDISRTGTPPEAHFDASASIRLPGQNTPVLGVQSLNHSKSRSSPAFFTWSGSGRVLLWDLSGRIEEQLSFCVDEVHKDNEMETCNQLCVVAADEDGQIFAGGDRNGVLMIIHRESGEQILKVKAHSSEVTNIAVRYNASKALIATSSRDRTVQLFRQTSDGLLDLLQTLEFPARVNHLTLSSNDQLITSSMDHTVQIHDLKRGPTAIVAVPCKSITLRAAPTSVALDSETQTLLVSSADKSVHIFEIDSGRLHKTFKCADENTETAVLESLLLKPAKGGEAPLLFGFSNNDKSVRIYNREAGAFTNREWGHTESVSGIALVQDEDGGWKLVSVGSDGTIMVFDLEQSTSGTSSTSNLPSGAASCASGPPIRRVLSKPELTTFSGAMSLETDKSRGLPRATYSKQSQKDAPSSATRSRVGPVVSAKAKPNDLQPRRTAPNQEHSSFNVNCSTPTEPSRISSQSTSSGMIADSQVPGASHQVESLEVASDYICRQLRAYRNRLFSTTSVTAAALAELEAELRYTSIELNKRLTITSDDNANLADAVEGLSLGHDLGSDPA